MTNAAAVSKPRLGFRFCPSCGAENHYKKLTCAACSKPTALTPEQELDQAKAAALGEGVVDLPGAAIVVEPYVVMQDFRTMLGNVTGVFKKGMVLTDWGQIMLLREAGNPIVPASQSKGVVCCPKCQHVFPMVATTTGRKSAG